nr:translation initiation factor IF-3 [Fimbriimonadaceae bacterium]
MRLREVRLIDENGAQLGVFSTKEALTKAQDAELDLVLVAGTAQPPVARITDYGRWKYEQEKRKKDEKKKVQEVKGIKISPTIAEHDLQTAVRKARQFLGEGHKVRVVCRFTRRELAHPEVGKRKLDQVSVLLEDLGKRDRDPALAGQEMVIVITPKPAQKEKKNAKA